jgi:hypothetical protein
MGEEMAFHEEHFMGRLLPESLSRPSMEAPEVEMVPEEITETLQRMSADRTAEQNELGLMLEQAAQSFRQMDADMNDTIAATQMTYGDLVEAVETEMAQESEDEVEAPGADPRGVVYIARGINNERWREINRPMQRQHPRDGVRPAPCLSCQRPTVSRFVAQYNTDALAICTQECAREWIWAQYSGRPIVNFMEHSNVAEPSEGQTANRDRCNCCMLQMGTAKRVNHEGRNWGGFSVCSERCRLIMQAARRRGLRS